jgi:ribose transport system ATP-binding protein
MITPLIEMRSISKAFPGVQALKDVSLAVYGGEVHMLVGQNGAGKSTLIKVLCGAYHPDRGDFLRDGKPVHIESTKDGRRLGIAVIFQEFSSCPSSTSRRTFSGKGIPGTHSRHRGSHPDAGRGSTHSRSARHGPDTRIKVHELGVAQQQMVEIAKALSSTRKSS